MSASGKRLLAACIFCAVLDPGPDRVYLGVHAGSDPT